jgi:hypothetical protein
MASSVGVSAVKLWCITSGCSTRYRFQCKHKPLLSSKRHSHASTVLLEAEHMNADQRTVDSNLHDKQSSSMCAPLHQDQRVRAAYLGFEDIAFTLWYACNRAYRVRCSAHWQVAWCTLKATCCCCRYTTAAAVRGMFTQPVGTRHTSAGLTL